MLNLLKQQERTWKIPAGLPQGVKSANKTGELPDTENDAAIVFGETADYILCVMAQGLANTSQAQKIFKIYPVLCINTSIDVMMKI